MNTDRIYYSQDAKDHAMRDRGVLIAAFLTFGLGVGAAVALLFAPNSGKKTRHDLAKNVNKGLTAGRENLDSVVSKLELELADLRKKLEDNLKS